jgi:PEP-CTERM motif-containing protein
MERGMARKMRAIHQGIFCRGRVYRAALFVVLLSASAIVSSEAQTTYWNSSSLSGTFSWSSGLTGLSQTNGGELSLNLQSLYYSIGNGAVTALTNPTGAVVTSSGVGNNKIYTLTASYSLPNVGPLTWAIGLDGNTWNETITSSNASGASVNLHLFQYSDFVVGNAPGSQTLSISNTPTQGFFSQSGGTSLLTLSAQNTFGTTEVQADNTGAPFGPFIGNGTTLNNATLNDTGTVDFGVEFDATVAAGNLLTTTVSGHDPDYYGPQEVVPEPASVALVASGMALLALVFRRRLCASDRHA